MSSENSLFILLCKCVSLESIRLHILSIIRTSLIALIKNNGMNYDTYIHKFLASAFIYVIFCSLVYVIFIIQKRNNHISSIFFYQRPCQHHLMQRWIDVSTLPFVPYYLGIFPHIYIFLPFAPSHHIIQFRICVLVHFLSSTLSVRIYNRIHRNDITERQYASKSYRKMVLLPVLPWI